MAIYDANDVINTALNHAYTGIRDGELTTPDALIHQAEEWLDEADLTDRQRRSIEQRIEDLKVKWQRVCNGEDA